MGGAGAGVDPLTQLSGEFAFAAAVAIVQHSGASAPAFVISCHALHPEVVKHASQHAASDAAWDDPVLYLLIVSFPAPLMQCAAVGHGHWGWAPGKSSRVPQNMRQSVALQPATRSSCCR